MTRDEVARAWNLGGAVWAALALPACSAAAPPAEARVVEYRVPADDHSRCQRAVSKERAALEFRGAGAQHKNIRRVFEVGPGQAGERVLRCREIDTNLDGIKDVFRTYSTRGLPVEEIADADYDGKIDTWLRFSGAQVTEARIDVNGDGVPDEFRVYSGGKLARARRDTSLDGKVDTWEVYDQGRLRRVGKDVDGDGQVDRWQRDQAYERERARKRSEEAQAGASGAPDPAQTSANEAAAVQPQAPR